MSVGVRGGRPSFGSSGDTWFRCGTMMFVIGEALDFGADGAVISSATTIGCARLVNLYGITETTVRGVDHVRGWMTVRARRCDSVW